MSDDTNLDPSTFDVDGWIDGVTRPEITVELYPHEIEFARRLKALQDQIPAAEKASPENRGLDDATPEQLLVQIQELKAERTAKAMRVRVRQLVDEELVAAAKSAVDGKVSEKEAVLFLVSAACVEPALSVEQLKRLSARDKSGEGMVRQLIATVTQLQAGLPVPS